MIKGPTVTLTVKLLLAVVPMLSFAVTTNVNEPSAVNCPESVPSLAKDVPAGKAPEADSVYGGTPPVAPNLAENCDPTTPSLTAPVTDKGGAAMFSEYPRVAVFVCESVTLTLNENCPG